MACEFTDSWTGSLGVRRNGWTNTPERPRHVRRISPIGSRVNVVRIRLVLAIAVAIGALLISGCSATSDQAEIPSPAPADACAFDVTVEGVTAIAAQDETPQLIVADDAEVPTELGVTDLCVGEGKAVKATDTVTVNYVGVGYKTLQEFDSSYARGEPISFPLSQVIPGWTEGVTGMKPGGVRLLRIPADKAYGAQGNPPAIQPDEALAFIVELEDIE
jgi:peptidylprolyl isomerase